MSLGTERDILLSQTSDLSESQTGLNSGQDDRVIASTDPRVLVRCAQKGFDFDRVR